MTTAALLLSSCAVQIHDEQFCSPIPGGLGAVCDNFLTSNPLTLDAQGWVDWQKSLNDHGDAVECTSSSTLGDIKDEFEKLCSKTPCTYPQKQQVHEVVKQIDKIIAMGKDRLS